MEAKLDSIFQDLIKRGIKEELALKLMPQISENIQLSIEPAAQTAEELLNANSGLKCNMN